MLNPADAAYGLVGVYSPDISELMGESLMRLGMQHALVVHSCGLDELTPMGPAGAARLQEQGGVGGEGRPGLPTQLLLASDCL
jgi:anthranilate phosphoribosyltransferase